MKRYQLPWSGGIAEIEAVEFWSGCAGAQREYKLANGTTILTPSDRPLAEVPPPLPEEPGHYADKEGDAWRLTEGGRWRFGASDWTVQAPDFAPFTRLIPAPVPVEPVALPWVVECAAGGDKFLEVREADTDGHVPVIIRGYVTVYLNPDDAHAAARAFDASAGDAP